VFVAVATLISCSYRMSSDCRHTKGSISLSLGLGLSIWVDHYAVSVDDGHRVVCNFNLFVFFVILCWWEAEPFPSLRTIVTI